MVRLSLTMTLSRRDVFESEREGCLGAQTNALRSFNVHWKSGVNAGSEMLHSVQHDVN